MILCQFPYIQLQRLVPNGMRATLRLLGLLRLLSMLLQQGFPLGKVGILEGRECQGDALPVLLQILFQGPCICGASSCSAHSCLIQSSGLQHVCTHMPSKRPPGTF